MAQVLVDIEGVEVFRIEAGEKHIDNDRDVDLLCGWVVGVRPLLVFDPLLYILIVKIELADAMIGAIASVVVGEDRLEGRFLSFGIHFIVRLLLR